MSRLKDFMKKRNKSKPQPPQQKVSLAKFHTKDSLRPARKLDFKSLFIGSMRISSGVRLLEKNRDGNPVENKPLSKVFPGKNTSQLELGPLKLGDALRLAFPDGNSYLIHVSGIPAAIDPPVPFVSISILRQDTTWAWEDVQIVLGRSITFIGEEGGDSTFSLKLKDMMLSPADRLLRASFELSTFAD